MKAISIFRPRVAPRVPGCLNELIDQAVLDTCIDFSERSLAVRRMVDSFNTQAGVNAYDLDANVAHVIRAWADSVEMRPLNDATTNVQMHSPAVGSTTTGQPRYFAEGDDGQLILYPIPDKAYVINMRVAIRPTRSASSVEDILFERFVNTIVDGALARLYEMPGEWANPALFKVHADKYESGVNDALLHASTGVASGELRVTPVRI